MQNAQYRGFNIRIQQDNDAESPDSWDDGAVFLTGYHRDFFVKRDGFDQETVSNALRWVIYGKADAVDSDYLDRAKELAREFHIFPLYAYIHSGVSLSLGRGGQFSDRWDSCTVGAVFVSKKETRFKAKSEKLAAGLVETWDQYLSGEVYGYSIDGIEAAGCWGFYGEPEKSGLMEAARGDIDYHIEQRTKDHAAEVKSWIKNNIPLIYHKPLQLMEAA